MNLYSLSHEEVSRLRPDVLVMTCGYEPRAISLTEMIGTGGSKLISIDMKSAGLGAFDLNRVVLQNLKATFIPPERTAKHLVNALIALLPSDEASAKIAVDISSMPGDLLAYVLEALASFNHLQTDVYFLYSASNYSPPPEPLAPIEISEPVSPYLAGKLEDTTRPASLIIGLGYEPGRALGCLDYFEPSEIRVFVPNGQDPRFKKDVLEVNADLLEILPDEHIAAYDPEDVLGTMEMTHSIAQGLDQSTRVVILPMGPKIFKLSCYLVSVLNDRKYCIWRISGGRRDLPVFRTGSGQFMGVRVSF